ncbi:MAG: alpha/beta fold hydrolase [Sciscionella sp.]
MNKLVAALSTAGLLAGGLIAGLPAQAAPAAPASAQINWGPCTSETLQSVHAQCGMLAVPMDYSKPNGKKISLAVSRVRHTVPDSQYQGVMLVNPGGPGGSGLTLSVLAKYVPKGAGNAYDWIGFDPRGVGSSRPAIHCESGYFDYGRPNYIPFTTKSDNEWATRSKRYAQDCGRKYGALLDNMKTTDSVADMESIRKALGAKQINYYGFSYGTYLGQVYSTLHPNRVRRMVLDSNVDPRKVWYQANIDQNIAFDRNIKIWFSWVAKYDNVFHLGKTESSVEHLWYAERAKLTRHPAAGKIGPNEWTDIFLQAGYYRFGWKQIGHAFADYVKSGKTQQLLDLYAPNLTAANENEFAVYNAVQCTDKQVPGANRQFLDNWTTYTRAPFETWDNARFNEPCQYWPAKAGTPTKVNGSKVKSALLIDEELDAATPYPGSLEVRKLYPHSSLIAEPGGATHADSLSGDACVDNQVADYLATGKLPARKSGNRADTLCKPLPDPVPSNSGAAAAAQPSAGNAAQRDLASLRVAATPKF